MFCLAQTIYRIQMNVNHGTNERQPTIVVGQNRFHPVNHANSKLMHFSLAGCAIRSYKFIQIYLIFIEYQQRENEPCLLTLISWLFWSLESPLHIITSLCDYIEPDPFTKKVSSLNVCRSIHHFSSLHATHCG